MSFVHLHVHSHYSMLDGACRVQDLVKRAKQYDMPAVAITDHGCLHGLVEHYTLCRDAGIKPLLGIEAYVSPTHRSDRTTRPGEGAYHLLLLAQDLTGYRNLLKLSSLSYREGFYYKPRIDKALLKELSAGLVGTSACLGGEVCGALMKRDMKQARHLAEQYVDIFGPDRFFIEVQNNGIPEQDAANPELAELARKLGVGLVGTNDVHFLDKDDHFAHNCLCCISVGKEHDDPKRLIYPTSLYFRTSQEMRDALSDYPEAYDNTRRIADMCDVELDFGKQYAPVYKVPESAAPASAGVDADEAYLRQLCEEGLDWRYGTRQVSADVRQRLETEIGVIAGKGFCSYFLIVWDFCNYAREQGIPVGARGSGVGTMVGYLLGLCDVDPVKYGLLFERFMDPSRSEMPDIDIDICMNGRQKVIDYVRNKYGHVAQIITFGTLAAKAAVRDVGRVMKLPLAEVDKITKLIPTIPPGIKLDDAIARVPDLRELYKTDAQVKQIIDIAKRLEGLCRNAGCHAAGVVIADQPLDDLIPLYQDKDGNVLTQYEGPIVDKCGLLKMDFLGLRTLTTLQRSVDLVRRTKGLDIDPEKLPLDDQQVLDLFRRGETRGVFQFESGGMQDLLMKMRPDRLEDLIAANALYRPGPMELIPTYCDRKHAREQVPQVHPLMDELLAETYGIMCYQEQVMQIFNTLGGIELASAYKLIKAISKKKADVIEKFKPQFLDGATSRGLDRKKAAEIFDLILKFGGYGFNKSHSTRYAIIAYQTAYMKVYHPVEYMAALLTFESGNTEKVVEYIEECKRVRLPGGGDGIRVLPPDVNASGVDFTPSYEEIAGKSGRGKARPATDGRGVIRFGLAAVRGVGEKAVETVIAERDRGGAFRSLYDFCERVDARSVQKSTADALIRCGAFGGVHPVRAALSQALDRAYEVGQRTQEDKRSGQAALFGVPEPTASTPAEPMPDVPEFESGQLLKFEKELLGFYLTNHPLTRHDTVVGRYTTASTREAVNLGEGAEIVLGAMITAVRSKVAKSGRSAGQRWAILEFEDLEGKIEGMCFAEVYADVQQRYPDALTPERIVFVKAKVDRRREAPCLIVNDVIPLEAAASRLTTAVKLVVDSTIQSPEVVAKLRPVLAGNRGGCDVYLQLVSRHVKSADGSPSQPLRVTLRFGPDLRVCPDEAFVDAARAVLGDGGVELVGEGTKRLKRLEQQRMFPAEAADTSAGASGHASADPSAVGPPPGEGDVIDDDDED